jgi:ABC-type uncharacterized transport system substrate-binding protein
MREQAEEVVRLKVDVIVAPSSIYTAAARRATSTIPIVFLSHADPLGTGHVASLSRPGGNVTGLSLMSCSRRRSPSSRMSPSSSIPLRRRTRPD